VIAEWGQGHWTWQESPASLESRRRREHRRAALIMAMPGLLAGLVVGAIVGVLGPWWAGLVVAVGVASVVSIAVRAQMLPGLLGSLGARLVDPTEQPRLANVVEGLCLQMGLRMPGLWMVEGEIPNALALGIGSQAALVVTSSVGLLSRVELEALLAHELSHLRRADAVPATAAVWIFGRLQPSWVAALTTRGQAGAELREVEADLAGLGVTRYPPALLSVLAGFGHRAAEVVPTGSRLTLALGSLWALPLSMPGEQEEARRRIERRVDLVSEL